MDKNKEMLEKLQEVIANQDSDFLEELRCFYKYFKLATEIPSAIAFGIFNKLDITKAVNESIFSVNIPNIPNIDDLFLYKNDLAENLGQLLDLEEVSNVENICRKTCYDYFINAYESIKEMNARKIAMFFYIKDFSKNKPNWKYNIEDLKNKVNKTSSIDVIDWTNAIDVDEFEKYFMYNYENNYEEDYLGCFENQ